MKVKVLSLARSYLGVLICLLSVSVSFSIPGVDFDIWRDEGAKNEMVLNNWTRVVEESHINRLPRVLNFFPVPFVEECRAKDGRRRGICMNTYECRIQGGKSHGFCALGFGVCCVFTATCKQEVRNNLTYFVNPDYPDLTTGMTSCSLSVKIIDSEVSQIRFDFVHFSLGQPNRQTGVCEEDILLISAKNSSSQVKMCGMNSGQHVYFDVENVEDYVEINMILSKKAVARFWEIIITQIPFTDRAPPDCLQYHEGKTGEIQTMNFADNGRHLANQDYTICIRQEENMCSIAYQPCHENSFKIDPNTLEDPQASVNIMMEDGSGDYEIEEKFRALDTCNDKIILPCDSEELLMPGMLSITPGFCSLIHCGSSLCPLGNTPCRIESSAKPFTIGVHFGSSVSKSSPEDNIGMCLTYEQIPCGE